MIKLENVNKYFNRHKRNQIHVIDNTSLEFDNKGFICLLGESGCGKTTLLNSIGGLDKVNSGKIYIDNELITKKCISKVDKIRNLYIGYIFQDYNLVDELSVFDNIALSLKINGIKDKDEITKRVNYCLEKVNMHKYRNRYASMLSGGEKQRVAIARAIVKNPNILICDEPTGNLDSKNTIEIMNIIKAISKDKLVIMVTHEKDLAALYADKIIDIKDGKIEQIRDNTSDNIIDYQLDNKIYLKDFKVNENTTLKGMKINYYSDEEIKDEINIIVRSNNIFISTNKRVEVINNDSSIELVNDHYRKLDKSVYEKYKFDFENIINKDIKYKYSSIFNLFSFIKNGFKKVFNYPRLKKVLLIGFFISGMFVMNAISNSLGVNNIKDEDFITLYSNYLIMSNKKISKDDYLKYESNSTVKYALPGDSKVNFKLKVNDFYQTANYEGNISSSLVDISLIDENDIVYGKYPENNKEVVIDIYSVEKFLENKEPNMVGILSYKDLLNREIYINDYLKYKIVGFTDKTDIALYVNSSEFINILYNQNDEYSYVDREYIDYELVKDYYTLKKGNYPTNDYEVIIDYELRDIYKLNKTIDKKINGNKLKVVGYYESSKLNDKYLVSNNTIKYDLINELDTIAIYSENKEETISNFNEMGILLEDSYTKSKNDYVNSVKDSIKSSNIVCIIILSISLIEIYLMIRSSFLSRIKEVGIYRAIGVKKNDIRKMFVGEILAITTIASVPGILFMAYIIKELNTIDYFSSNYLINPFIVIMVILFVYIFNIIIGLLPVNRVLIQRPAKILSRNDI